MKLLKEASQLMISLAVAIQITGFSFGMYLSNDICHKGLKSVPENIAKDVDYYAASVIYPSVKIGAASINSLRSCEK